MRIRTLMAVLLLSSAVVACSADPASNPFGVPADDGAAQFDGASSDGGDSSPTSDAGALSNDGSLPFKCSPPPQPNPCAAPSGKNGEASFCLRPAWAGVTGVDVYTSKDWKTPLVQLTGDGTGRFSGKAALADGTYAYVFRTHGGSDGVTKDGQYLIDPENPAFMPSPNGSPVPRSNSVIVVPQSTSLSATHHLKGVVSYQGAAQPCYPVDLEVGELLGDGGVISEHGTGNFTETRVDGTFDFQVADGLTGLIVRYPFGLRADYPDPLKTPSIGIARTGATMGGSDVTVDPLDVAYPLADYALMRPIPGATIALPTSSAPLTFTFSIVGGWSQTDASIASTRVAGNDPSWTNGFGTSTTAQWDGAFLGKLGNAKPNVQYYWGAWQTTKTKVQQGWVAQSLLFPLTFK